MGDRSKIEWTDATWNPVRARRAGVGYVSGARASVGWHCAHVSEGCRNCYAEAINRRLGTRLAYKPAHRERGDVEILLDERLLTQPLRWRRPRMIFVGSMTDVFADFVADAWLDRLFAAMALCPRHTFQVLTKRPERMRAYASCAETPKRVWTAANEIMDALPALAANGARWGGDTPWPLRNVWLGVSVEDQPAADDRVPLLLDTPAAVRWVSYEPALGPVRFDRIPVPGELAPSEGNALTGRYWPRFTGIAYNDRTPRLDWIVAGGESGPGARAPHPDWFRSVRDQCAAAGVPFLFKQWGEWAPHRPVAGGDLGGDDRAGRVRIVHPTGQTDVEVSVATGGRSTLPGSRYMARVGKKAAGRALDGVVHDAWPHAEAAR